MKTFTRITVIISLILGNLINCYSQCLIEASKFQTIVCGGSTKLSANAVLNLSYFDTTYLISSVSFVNADTGYAMGNKQNTYSDHGTVFKTINGGNSWNKILDTLIMAVSSIHFTDGNTGYVVGSGGIRKTIDGGLHWDMKFYGYSSSFNSVYFTSQDTGFAAGDNGKIRKTTNAGASWDQVNNDSTKMLYSIHFADRTTGYAVGVSPYEGWTSYILKSTNAGKNWTRIIDTIHFELHAVYFINPDTGYSTGLARYPYYYGWTSGILKTVNGGKSWKVVKRVQDVSLNYIYFIDAKNGYAAGSNGTILRTTDGGDSWIKITSKTTNSFNCIDFPTADKGIFVGSQTGIGVLSIPESFSWSPNVDINDTNLAEPTVSNHLTATYTVTAKFKSGCTATDSAKVYVTPLYAFASDVKVACGNNANLIVGSNYTGSGILSYAWSPALYLSDSTLSNPVAVVNKPTTFSVEISSPDGCKASTSLIVLTNILDIQPSICLVTVADGNKNLVVWEKLVSTAIDSFLVYRESNNQTGVYDLIGKTAYAAQSIFIDSASNSLVQSNRYAIAIKDHCSFYTTKSLPHKTMHLNINQAQGNNWNLIWEQYEGFDVSSYKIYRGTTISDLQLIGSTAGGNSSYTDFSAPAGTVYYQIEVISPSSCSTLKSSSFTSSRSNIASNGPMGIPSLNSGYFKVFPVPAVDELFFNLQIMPNSRLSISTLDGKILVNSSLNSNQNSINVQSLPKGMYLLKIVDNKNSYITRFIKE